ncbi:related to Meiotically up-regulated gene 157 protein [Phialocephala subalpina]|uniref:Related to Meiotically up-regulated gene 157 protein n=1 Tax=Phialocephala subalpina TaxID=576137 RepID=A0A1L7X7F3_9HELO|nr:related to Meiotically up-regulated gene 157 protein [Phialocephala subalpina]
MSRLRLRFVGIAVLLVVAAAFFFWRDDAHVTWSSFPSPAEDPSLKKDAVEQQLPLKVSTAGTSPISKPIKTSELPTDLPVLPKPETTRWQDSESPAATPSPSAPPKPCLNFMELQREKQKPWSTGWRRFAYNRPGPECRTFNLPAMEKLIEKMKGVIKDPDLFRLFENSYPNTLDTMIKWRGYANIGDPATGNETVTDEELTYVITGDIDAMWLRDSASQVYSYLPLLEASSDPDSLASLWRGLINLHARYIIISPYCHSFQPPPESGVPNTRNGAFTQNHPMPPYDPNLVFDCKWELDSLASFLQVSVAYYQRTGDLEFFDKYNWIPAVRAAVDAAAAMRLGTYSKTGKVQASAWTFTGWTNRGSETLTNDGLGNPTKENGMVRTAFRPSDDACIYQLLVPANMMWAKYLEEASIIMEKLSGDEAKNLTDTMRDQAYGVRKGIDEDAIIHNKDFGDIFAYEIDGFGGTNMMDDANVPSLLAMPLWNYSTSAFKLPVPTEGGNPRDYDRIYANTRRFILSESNPYFMKGPVISAIGGPHLGPGKAWPMAAIIRALTAFTLPPSDGEGSVEQSKKKAVEDEIKAQIAMVLNSTAGTGVIHESVNSWNENDWSRAWFGWANGLFGELMIKVAEEDEKAGRNPGWLGESWQ